MRLRSLIRMELGASIVDDVVFECHANDIDVRVAAGIGVLIIKTDNGRAVVSVPEDVLERLPLLIRLESDGAAGRRSHGE